MHRTSQGFLISFFLLSFFVSESPAQTNRFDSAYREALARNPPGISFRIELEAGRHRFQQGEIIRLQLDFSSRLPDAYVLRAGDLSRRSALGSIQFHASPANGAVDPLHDYYHGLFGFAGCSLGGLVPLTAESYRTQCDLSQWLRFDVPGTYRVYSTIHDIRTTTDPQTPAGSRGLRELSVVSNLLELEIMSPDSAWLSHTLEEAVQVIKSEASDQETRAEACRKIRYLGTAAAVREMAANWDIGDSVCEQEFYLGLMAFPDRARAVRELEERLRNPEQLVSDRFVTLLSSLAFLQRHPSRSSPVDHDGRLAAYREIVSGYLVELIGFLPHKRPRSQAAAIKAVLDLHRVEPGLQATSRMPLDDLSDLLPAVFLHLSPRDQEQLLQYHWSPLATPQMVPVLDSAYEQSPEKSLLRDWVLKRLYELNPKEGRRLILEQIGRFEPAIGLEALTLLPRTAVRMDDVLAENLEQAEDSGLLPVHSRLVERYGGPGAVPTARGIYEKHEGRWACDIQAALLAYFLRLDPRLGLQFANRALHERETTGCYRTLFSSVGALFRSPHLERLAAQHLNDVDPEVARDASQFLRLGTPPP